MATEKTLYEWTSWDHVEDSLSGTPSLLLGNGFSIHCDTSFIYSNLLQVASDNGLPDRIRKVFEHAETTNFEAVMHLLDDVGYTSKLYGCSCDVPSQIEKDIEETRRALIEAVTVVHGKFKDASLLAEEKKAACATFLTKFPLVFTLCYDFLLYWVIMYGQDKGIIANLQDGFFGDNLGDARAFAFLKRHSGFRFLHGALHLFVSRNVTAKYVYQEGQPLLEHVRTGLARGRYPLFIAEGKPYKKLAGIQRQPYLNACWEDFEWLGPDLVVYGCALEETDEHIVKAIVKNRHLERLYVAVYGNPGEPQYEKLLAATSYIQRQRPAGHKLKSLKVFPATEVPIWST